MAGKISHFMKNKKLLFAALFAAVMGMVACEKETDIPQIPDGTDLPETYTVSLACGGELDVTYNPMSRFTPDSNDLYAVQVTYAPTSGGGTKKYAYGLFDDPSKMNITLLADYKYNFEILLVDDAKTKIYSDSILVDNSNYYGYGKPFDAYNGYNASNNLSITKVTNEFIIAEDKYFYDLLGGNCTYFKVADGMEWYAHTPNVESYYGKVSGYVPTADGEQISIYLKRMVFGLKVVAGDWLTEGYLSVSNKYSAGNTPDYFKLTPENKVFERIYSYNYGGDNWYSKDEEADAKTTRDIQVTWHKNDSVSIALKKISITCYRNKQTVVNIEYDPSFYEDEEVGGNSLAIKYEDTELEEGYKSVILGDAESEYDIW